MKRLLAILAICTAIVCFTPQVAFAEGTYPPGTDFALTGSLPTLEIKSGTTFSVDFNITNVGTTAARMDDALYMLTPPEFTIDSFTTPNTNISCIYMGNVGEMFEDKPFGLLYPEHSLYVCYRTNHTDPDVLAIGDSVTFTLTGHANIDFVSGSTQFYAAAMAISGEVDYEATLDLASTVTNNFDPMTYSFVAQSSSGFSDSGAGAGTPLARTQTPTAHVQGNTSEQDVQKISTPKGLSDLVAKKGKPELSLHKPSFGKHNTIPPEATMSLLARYRNELIGAGILVIFIAFFLTHLRVNYVRNKRQNREYRKALKIAVTSGTSKVVHDAVNEDESLMPSKPLLHFEHTEKIQPLAMPSVKENSWN